MLRSYEEPPRKVFCFIYSQLRVIRMTEVLSHYKKHFRPKAKKEDLLKKIDSLMAEVPRSEAQLIADWLTSGSGRFEEALKNGECSVCMEYFPKSNSYAYFPERPITTSCNHKVMVCKSCIKQSIDLQIDDQHYDQVSCPECPEKLKIDIVAKFSSPAAFERYAEKGFLEAIEKMDGYVKCIAPNCKSGQIHGSGHDQPIVTCVACHFKSCYTHNLPWHTEQTCDQYDTDRRLRWGNEEEATRRALKKSAKACPNQSCGYLITKTGGCDHMTCRQCRHEFCWLCMAPYLNILREGNSAHAKSCQYHSARPTPVPQNVAMLHNYDIIG